MPSPRERNPASGQSNRGALSLARRQDKPPRQYAPERTLDVFGRFRMRVPRLIDVVSIAMILIAAYIYCAVLVQYPI
jgi:hypothetical protein